MRLGRLVASKYVNSAARLHRTVCAALEGALFSADFLLDSLSQSEAGLCLYRKDGQVPFSWYKTVTQSVQEVLLGKLSKVPTVLPWIIRDGVILQRKAGGSSRSKPPPSVLP